MKIYTYESVCKKCEKAFQFSRNTPKGPNRKTCPDCKPAKKPSNLKLISVVEQEG